MLAILSHANEAFGMTQAFASCLPMGSGGGDRTGLLGTYRMDTVILHMNGAINLSLHLSA